jgi:hypothetical protein
MQIRATKAQRVWHQPGTRLEKKNFQPSVKYGGSVMVRICMAASNVGNLVLINGIIDRHVYASNLSENLGSYLVLGVYTFQQDNDKKHTS